RSTAYTAPVRLPLPAPAPPSFKLAASAIESLSTRFKPSVPVPVPADAVTMNVAALPASATPVIAGEPPTPDTASAKSVASTLVTGSLNVTVQCTVDAAVGVGSSSVIDVT